MALRRVLSWHGYDVIDVGGLRDAQAALHPDDEIDVVVTDYVLPDGTGPQLVGFVRRLLCKEVPAVLLSAWELPEGKLPPGASHLKKPLDPGALLHLLQAKERAEAMVRKILSEPCEEALVAHLRSSLTS